MMRIARLGGLGGLLLAIGAAASAPDISAKVVNYDDLGKFVRSQRGKVVVVDFWANW
jgi:thiol-disulfide isomerase/thioredoxin